MQRRLGPLIILAILLTAVPLAEPSTALDQGFRHLYALHFEQADQEFEKWQQLHPDDPRGPVGQAAGLLFSEFNRLGILESELFQDNERFVSRTRPKPDQKVGQIFEEHLTEAERLASSRLRSNPRDSDALFATALVSGLRADYTALILKQNMASLRHTKVAAESARRLLTISPEYYDGYLATGISNYIVGSLFPPVRWFLRLGGYSGDKQKGLQDLRLVAEKGRLMAPFARLLLAVAHLRDGQATQARALLIGLRDEFPSNPLYQREIARIDQRNEAKP